jgi:hypothetical protein
VFPIARGSSAARWFCGVIGILTFGLGAFLGTLWLFGNRIVKLEVSDRGLQIRGDVYGRLIPTAALQVRQARAFDGGVDSGHKPTSRTNGTGLPNYQSGWFQLANGSKALLFVTDWSKAVVVPTSDGFELIVSPEDPRAFLGALTRPGASATTFALSSSPLSGSTVMTLLLGIGFLVPLAIAALMGYLAYSTRATRFEVSDDGLRIRGDLFGRLIPRSSLLVKIAEIVDLTRDQTHRPWLRTMGVGLPGYYSGWFRLHDRGKALLFLTDRSRAVYMPTTDGYALLISPADPERFLSALNA